MASGSSGNKNGFTAFILHIHPRTVPEETLRFGLSFGLGGMAVTLFFVLVLSGILQLLSYSPHPDSAYSSIQQIYFRPNLGGFTRNIHYWAGNLLIIISTLHLLRVFFTGALRSSRKFNWLIGIAILLLVQFANFTGYLLPWDQLAYWAVTIFTNMVNYIPLVGGWLVSALRGGNEVGSATLSNFYAIHIAVIPAILIFLLVWHFWLIRKAGGLVTSPDIHGHKRKRVAVVPHLIVRELATGLVLLALLLSFAALLDAPLAEPANPGESPNPAKAAWYFMGLQELLLHVHPIFGIAIVPALMVIGLAVIPFIPDAALPEGEWFGGRRGAKLACLSFLLSFFTTLLIIVIDDNWLRAVENTVASENTWLLRGLLPCILGLLLLAGIYQFLKKRGYSKSESVMALVITNIGCICALTAVGIWLRGPGMKLIWF